MLPSSARRAADWWASAGRTVNGERRNALCHLQMGPAGQAFRPALPTAWAVAHSLIPSHVRSDSTPLSCGPRPSGLSSPRRSRSPASSSLRLTVQRPPCMAHSPLLTIPLVLYTGRPHLYSKWLAPQEAEFSSLHAARVIRLTGGAQTHCSSSPFPSQLGLAQRKSRAGATTSAAC